MPELRAVSGGTCSYRMAPESTMAVADLEVEVREDGSIGSIRVVSESDEGMGEAARQCLLANASASPARDADGNPITKTFTIRVRARR